MRTLLPVPWLTRGHLRHRTQQIATVLGKHGLNSLAAQVGLSDSPLGALIRLPQENPSTTPAQRFRQALAELDGTFIKLGQARSTRPDLLPAELVTELSKLQDAAPAAPFEAIRN